MKAIVARAFGEPEVLVLSDVPDPTPGPGEVRVRIHAVGVNPFDTYMRSGGYSLSPALPYTPGCDAGGVIDGLGAGVTGFHEGDRVYVSGTTAGHGAGTYAELAICRPQHVHPLPDRLSFTQGAGIHVPYATAWRALMTRAAARPGDTVLVHGASGGVGLAAVQIARAMGLTVIGTAGTPDGVDLVRAQGAHHALNHRTAGYLDGLGDLTGGRGADIVLESLANVNLDRDLSALARGGRVVVIGSRGRVEIDPRKTMGKDAAVLGMSLWNVTEEEMARIHRALGAGFAQGWLTPFVGTELPLADAARAHRLILEPGAHGKIVLVP